jgi:MFS family permease
MEPQTAAPQAPTETPSLMETWKVLFAKRTFRHIAAGLCILITGTGAASAFLGPYYIRQFSLNYAEVGLIIGLMTGFTSIFGTIAGGYLAQRLGKNDPKWYLLTPAIGLLVAAPITLAAYLQNNWMVMAGLLLVAALFQAVYLAPCFAATHNMVSPKMRATAAATIYFFMNIIGMSLGPPIAGFAIDVFSAQIFAGTGLGAFTDLCPGGVGIPGSAAAVMAACHTAQAEGTRWVLLIAPPMILWAAFHYYMASRTIAKELNPA